MTIREDEKGGFQLGDNAIEALQQKFASIPFSQGGASGKTHEYALLRQTLFLTLYEACTHKRVRVVSRLLGLKPEAVSHWRQTNPLFQNCINSLQGEAPHIDWREQEPYKQKLKELDIEDYPRFPVTVRPTLQFSKDEVTRIVQAYQKAHTSVQRQAILLLLFQDQPDRNLEDVSYI